MDIKIYQIDHERDIHNVKFMSLDRIEKYQGSPDVDSSIYNMVWQGTVSAENMEDVFSIFNFEHPADFTGHSLSVSDIVQVLDAESHDNFYFCDSFGFKRIEFKPEKSRQNETIKEEEGKTISLWARVGVSLEVTPEQLEILKGDDTKARTLLVDLIRSDKAIICGETYFPEPANEGYLTEDLNFYDIYDVPLQENMQEVPDNKFDITLSTLDSIISSASSRAGEQAAKEQSPGKGQEK